MWVCVWPQLKAVLDGQKGPREGTEECISALISAIYIYKHINSLTSGIRAQRGGLQ